MACLRLFSLLILSVGLLSGLSAQQKFAEAHPGMEFRVVSTGQTTGNIGVLYAHNATLDTIILQNEGVIIPPTEAYQGYIATIGSVRYAVLSASFQNTCPQILLAQESEKILIFRRANKLPLAAIHPTKNNNHGQVCMPSFPPDGASSVDPLQPALQRRSSFRNKCLPDRWRRPVWLPTVWNRGWATRYCSTFQSAGFQARAIIQPTGRPGRS